MGYWLNAFYIAKLEDEEEADEHLIEESTDVAVKIGELVLAEDFGFQRARDTLFDMRAGIDKRFFKYCFQINAMFAKLIHRDEQFSGDAVPEDEETQIKAHVSLM